jgi:hypothetical protein
VQSILLELHRRTRRHDVWMQLGIDDAERVTRKPAATRLVPDAVMMTRVTRRIREA